MFSLKTCSVDGCHTRCAGEETCYHHSRPGNGPPWAQSLLAGSNDLFDLSVSEAHFSPHPPPRRMAGSNLAWCTFTDVDFNSLAMTNCFFDFFFERCRNAVDVRHGLRRQPLPLLRPLNSRFIHQLAASYQPTNFSSVTSTLHLRTAF